MATKPNPFDKVKKPDATQAALTKVEAILKKYDDKKIKVLIDDVEAAKSTTAASYGAALQGAKEIMQDFLAIKKIIF